MIKNVPFLPERESEIGKASFVAVVKKQTQIGNCK